MIVHTSHPDYAAFLNWASRELGLPEPPRFGWDLELDLTGSGIFAEFDLDELDAEADFVRLGVRERAYVACLKASLICADVAGSAAVDPGSLAHGLEPTSFRAMIDDRLAGRAIRPFQESVAEAPGDVVLVLAGCGTGKTVAAYLRALRRYTGRRLLFCYPTTGTATEGFRGYLLRDGLDSALIHSRAQVDWRLLEMGDEEDPDALRAAVESLGLWTRPIAACTVDTVLGLLQNNRRGLYGFPVIAGSVIVFDEIHSYDPRLFANLLRFLREFPGVPAVLMTASLQADRLARLQGLLRDRLSLVHGPEDLETVPRYRLHSAAPGDAGGLAGEALRAGGKVLWVCNRVAVAQHAYQTLSDLGTSCELYHSRYRYRDRVLRHKAVIEAFARPGAALAISTQVCEQSLDLDADLLVTELAPVWALIQRLGRLNRFAAPDGSSGVRSCVIVEPSAPHPYTPEELERARTWLDRLAGRDLSQRDLVHAWEQGECPADPVNDETHSWLDGGFTTRPSQVREARPEVPCLLGEDARKVIEGEVSVEEVAIPMTPPFGIDLDGSTRVAYCLVPPPGALAYDEEIGGRWASRR